MNYIAHSFKPCAFGSSRISKQDDTMPPKNGTDQKKVEGSEKQSYYDEEECRTEAPVVCEIKGEKAVGSIAEFEDPKLGLDHGILENIKCLKWEKPTPVQCYAMPQMMAKLDLMCCSYTGSGKTNAYLLPLINLILQEKKSNANAKPPLLQGKQGCAAPRALILVPTRELAEQIAVDATKLAANLSESVKTVAIFGGDSLGKELSMLRRQNPNVIVATPGRMMHMLSEFDVVTLEETKYLVIDEADEMYNVGFFPQIGEIIEYYMVPKEDRVNFMFSATFERQIQTYARKHLRENYVYVAVGYVGGAAPDIRQDVRSISQVEKNFALLKIIEGEVCAGKVLVFCNKIETVIFVERFLNQRGINVTAIHSELEQAFRDLSLKEFNEDRKKVLVATSVASRGLNIKGDVLVINYDFPLEMTDYVQRIGRARSTDKTVPPLAISFFDKENDDGILNGLCNVLRQANQRIPYAFADIIRNNAKEEEELAKECINEDMKIKVKKFKTRRRLEYTDYEPDVW